MLLSARWEKLGNNPVLQRVKLELREAQSNLKEYYYRQLQHPKGFLLKVARFTTSIYTIFVILGILIMQSEKGNNSMPVVVLDTSTVDIFSGLYETVGNTLNSGEYGQTLSTSQIIAITNVTTSMLMDTPDYISSGLFNTCLHFTYHWRDTHQSGNSGNSNSNSDSDNDSDNDSDASGDNWNKAETLTTTESKAADTDSTSTSDSADNDQNKDTVNYNSNNLPNGAQRVSPLDTSANTLITTRIDCLEGSLYDYRGLLTDNFEVLANILFSESISVSTEAQEEATELYEEWRKPREAILKSSVISIITVCITQFLFFLFSIAYYILKKKEINESRLKAIENFLGINSIIIFLIWSYAAFSMVLVLNEFKTRIYGELSNFKIALHLSTAYFTLLWSVFISTLISMACWTMPIWCQTLPDLYDDEEDSRDLYKLNESDKLVFSYSDTDTFDGKTFTIPTLSLSSSKYGFSFDDGDDDLPRSLLDGTEGLIDVPFKHYDKNCGKSRIL